MKAASMRIDGPYANDNAPVLDLHAIGDGRTFYRALARIIVRRELISAGLIPSADACETVALAG